MTQSRSYSTKTPWWKDPSILGDASLIAGATTALVLTTLDLVGWLQVSWFTHNLSKLTVLLVCLLLLSGVAERRLLLSRFRLRLLEDIRTMQADLFHGVTSIYSSRDQLPSFSATVESTVKEVFISAIGLGYIALQELPTLERKAVSGCKIRLLLVDPGPIDNPSPLIGTLADTFDFPQIGEVVSTCLARLSEWRAQLPVAARNRVELRVTSSAPTHIAIFLDKDLPTGRVRLEMLPPRTQPVDRMSVLIEAKSGGKLYETYVKAYDELWREAQPYIHREVDVVPNTQGNAAS